MSHDHATKPSLFRRIERIHPPRGTGLSGMPMRIALIAIMVALLADPAYAQRGAGKGRQPESKQQQSAEQKKKARQVEEAYEAALKTIPDKKPSADPWKNVR